MKTTLIKLGLVGLLLIAIGILVDKTFEPGLMIWIHITLVVIYVVFACLFTWFFSRQINGDLTDNVVRRWFIFSYGFMFVAVAGAILPFTFSHQYEEKDTKSILNTPLLLLVGCSSDVEATSELSCEKNVKSKANAKSDVTTGAKSDATGAAKSDGTITVRQEQWLLNVGGKVQDCRLTGETSPKYCITGGLLVPLYYLVLALVGGAVSLTRRVPEYQKRSAASYVATEKEPKLDAPTTREYLVFQIVQFLSAPLIATVAYYLISPETRTTGVAVAFTCGFGSEAILLMIRQLVEKVSPESTTVPQTGSVSGVVHDSKSQPVHGATLKIVGKNLAAQSDPAGQFVLDGVPASEQAIEASQNGTSKIVKVRVDSGKTSICNIDF